MCSEVLRERLSALRRGQGPAGRARPAARLPASDLCDYFPEGAVCSTPHGEVFVCQTSLRELHSDAGRLVQSYLNLFRRRPAESGRATHLDLLSSSDPASAALIDTETAGFYGRPLFLVGLMRYQEEDLLLEQWFARDYAQEAGLLSQLAQALSQVKLLISFNGKAFDWPFVRDRMIYHRVPCRACFAHLDLLHPSRRRWRSQLPDCRLRTLERYLCGRWRSGDLPSAEIPQRYHDFVRQQEARLIAPIFHHNRLDLITMIELVVALGSE